MKSMLNHGAILLCSVIASSKITDLTWKPGINFHGRCDGGDGLFLITFRAQRIADFNRPTQSLQIKS